jgi:hypothetical protein
MGQVCAQKIVMIFQVSAVKGSLLRALSTKSLTGYRVSTFNLWSFRSVGFNNLWIFPENGLGGISGQNSLRRR